MTSVLKVDTIQSSGGTTGLTIGSNGLIKPKNVAFQFKATDTDQSIGNNATKVEWETVELDTGSYWDSTNHRYTPQVAGWYKFAGVIRFSVASPMKYANTGIYKNGSLQFRNQLQLQNDEIKSGEIMIATGLVQLNGSSDYVECFAQFDHTTTVHDSSSVASVFYGMLVHAT